jgi:hypothetical protein
MARCNTGFGRFGRGCHVKKALEKDKDNIAMLGT